MTTKIEIKNRFTGSILFDFECDGNTILKTVLEALRQKKCLISADLRSADLRFADLSLADLRYADLSLADLRFADLRYAKLSSAKLLSADLRFADLRYADLISADLILANFILADLSLAKLSTADLCSAKLSSANLGFAYFRENEKSAKAAIFTGLYRYLVIPYITETGEKRIKMGCYNRSLQEWETDFWNNPDDFPNDGSEASKLRLMAFNTAKEWFKIVSNE